MLNEMKSGFGGLNAVNPPQADRYSSVKTKLFIFLFLAGSIIPNLLFAQFTQQGPKLVGTGVLGNSRQGWSVAISSDGNTAIVGGLDDDNLAGAVWIFIRSGGVWTQQGPKLVGTGAVGTFPIHQGYSVAISSDGNTAITGAYGDNFNAGAVWVFTRSGGVWVQQGSKLVGTDAIGNAEQGNSVGISSDGNTFIVGGPADNSQAGAVWVFTRSGGVWTQQGTKLVGTGALGNAYQGWSAAISSDGNTAIVGGPVNNNTAGAVWVFTRSGGVWTQQGTKLVGTGAAAEAEQGWSVAISSDGNTTLVGGPTDNYPAGAVWVFTRSGGVWVQQGSKLVGTGGVGDVFQGSSVAISTDGNIAIEGGSADNNQVGAVWVFTRSGSVWTQQGTKLVGTDAVGFPRQGASVAISSNGGTAIVGGPDDDGAGAFWVFYDPTVSISTIPQEVPKSFSLSQNYPNPFNPATLINYSISKVSNVKLIIYDILGREVKRLVNNEIKSAGNYIVEFNGQNYTSGVYIYRIEAEQQDGKKFVESKKMVLIK
jgi:hypothetical protein